MKFGFQNFLARQWQDDRFRAFYWLPVFMGGGIGCYFLLDQEPPLSLAFLALIATGMAAFSAARFAAGRDGVKMIAYAALFFALGFSVAAGRTHWLGTKMLMEKLPPLPLTGTVRSIDRLSDGGRMIMNHLDWPEYRIPRNATLPETVRLKIRGNVEELHIGDRVQVYAQLMPPAPPSMPGAYDFGRYMYFEGIGASGFGFGKPKIIESGGTPEWVLRLNDLRDRIILRIYQVLDGDTAAVSAALITSEQSGLSADGLQAMRRSGLQHILSVSGFHLSLVGGLIFGAIRLMLAGIPALAVRGKKIAALAAIGGTFFYLVLSGFEIPTQRAFIMIGLVFLAVLADREALSMRVVAIAAMLVLLFSPETLLTVSFQLSFAAVVALIASYESWVKGKMGQERWWQSALYYFFLAAMTTLIASLATAPFIAYHFHQTTLQGVLANMVAGPLSTFWLMPLVIIVVLTMPFGLDHWPLVAMGWGVDGLLRIAHNIAALPGSMILIPDMPFAALLWIVGGGLWLLLWLKPWRYFGLIAILAGIVLAYLSPLPDVLINENGSVFGVRTDSGLLAVSDLKKDRFNVKSWNSAFAQEKSALWTDEGLWRPENFSCDAQGCRLHRAGRDVSFTFLADAFGEDCAASDVIVTSLRAPEFCRRTALVLDQSFLKQNGATAIWLGRNIRVETVREDIGARPWTTYKPELAFGFVVDDDEKTDENKGAAD